MKPFVLHLIHQSPAYAKRFLFFILLTSLSFHSAGQINAYASVTGISGNTLSLSNLNQTYHTFNAGDQIIIMQMQDNVAGANTTNTASFGAVTTIASAGLFEVATIGSVAGLPGSITITGALANTYNFGVNSTVQIISFRIYGSPDYTTTAAITALPWNGKIGGVVAMQVPGVLTVAYPITANGSGFRGGVVSANYEVNCEPAVYATSSANYAGKGEGIQINSTGLIYGRARLGNGAGGGSDDNGGGGGGANYTSGGQGGFGWTCSVTPSGGYGGDSIGAYISKYRVFMGGGGGGGQQNNSVGSSGANGGGIILLKANVLTTSCSGSVTISANGNSAASSGNDGSGGAGAAGSVVMSINSYSVPASCPLTVQAGGGNGGTVTDPRAHGGGGGGGQGAILYSSAVPVTNITSSSFSGNGGSNNSPASSKAGSGTGTANAGVLPSMGSFVLPVTLNDFSARVAGSDVLLTWNTAMEQGNSHFNVERSTDGISFNTIGIVQGAGDHNGLTNYSFADLSPAAGKYSYRLQQVDQDGAATYSRIVTISLEQAKKGMTIFPNPVTDQFTVQFDAVPGESYALSLIDLSGATVLSINTLPVNNQIHVAAGKKLIPGIYALRVSNKEGTLFSKIIVL